MTINLSRPLIAAVMLISTAFTALRAQDGAGMAREILSRLDKESVELEYSCSMDISGLPFVFEGKLRAQQDCYRAEGNGLTIICNGPVRWTVDYEAKEVYIENAGGVAEVLLYRDNVTNLKLDNVHFYPLSPDISDYEFDCTALDGEWIVSDLREP